MEIRIPLNVIHYYIGFPVFIYIAYHGIRQGRKTGNLTNFYMGFSALLFAIAVGIIGIPALFTQDSQILTWGNILSDLHLSVALMGIWLLAGRLYLPTKMLQRYMLYFFATILTVASIVIATINDFANKTTLVLENGVWQLNFPANFAYQLVYAAHFFSMILVGLAFWRQAQQIPRGVQRWRVRVYSILFLSIGALFIAQPIFRIQFDSQLNGSIMALFFSLVGVFSLLAWIFQRRQH
ncbi:hypothetical protein KBC99_01835 [Candidatus Saccharibacteria bacterium]|nr:hypothetical protein [Candidatus Saccharibacteria bacterium]